MSELREPYVSDLEKIEALYAERPLDTRAAAEELLLASMPPLRQPGDVTRDEAQAILSGSGYELRTTNQLCHALRRAGYYSLAVWDNSVKSEVSVWRKK